MATNFIAREHKMLNKVVKKMENFLDTPESDFFDEMKRDSEILLNYAKTLNILYDIGVKEMERIYDKT